VGYGKPIRRLSTFDPEVAWGYQPIETSCSPSNALIVNRPNERRSRIRQYRLVFYISRTVTVHYVSFELTVNKP